MRIVTRNIINKNIKFEDQKDIEENLVYNFNDLSQEIDAYKNLLESYGAKKGESALIGRPPGIDQTALFFACLELGVSIAIVDYTRKDSFQHYEYMDPKTDIILPIEYFIVSSRKDTDKFNFFKNQCNKTIILDEIENKDYTKNDNIYADEETVILKCTSSGTTGTPKKVIHTHNFFYELTKRNSKFFDKTVGMAFNLNHGSSVATYFLPALNSDEVTKFINLEPFEPIELKKVKEFHLNHLMVPYKNFLDHVPYVNDENIVYYTLSIIPSELRKYGVYKDIISIFGSNETSGPVFINRINHKNFKENSYFKVDDFYDINLVNRSLNVTLPVYNITIDTNDEFTITQDNTYIFQRRRDLTRINGKGVPTKKYDRIVKEYLDADLIYDYALQDIYLAVWNDDKNLKKSARKINKILEKESRGSHYIRSYKVLDRNEFLTGVKIDQELLREYFRKYS